MRAAYRSLLSTMEPDDIQQECNVAVLENPLFPGIACVNRIKSLCRRVYARKRDKTKTQRFTDFPVEHPSSDAKMDYDTYLSVCTPPERKAVEAKCHGQPYDRVAYHRGIKRIREAFNAG